MRFIGKNLNYEMEIIIVTKLQNLEYLLEYRKPSESVFFTLILIENHKSSKLYTVIKGSLTEILAETEKFSKLIVMPLVAECANPEFKSMSDKRHLCKNVEKLRQQIELVMS
jgi:hypothetical protein